MNNIQNSIFQRRFTAKDYPFQMCTRNYPSQIRHNPHPYYVRHIPGFLGLPTQIVETEGDDSINAKGRVNQFIKDSFKRGDWNYKDPANIYIKKSKDLDSILALQYFTGLQNYSFKEDYLPYLGYREYFSDWRRKLRNLTEATYQPFLEKSKNKIDIIPELQHPNEWINGQRLQSRSKSMYSETGRLMTRDSKTNTSSSQRFKCSAIRPWSNITNKEPNFNELDAVIFTLLADLLQTQSVHVIQSWLSQSTERERALITSMLQATVSKSTPDIEGELPTRKAETTELKTKTNLNINQSKNKSSPTKMEEANILIIEPREGDNKKAIEIRPPTSSTFKQLKDNTEESCQMRTNIRDSKSSVWSQNSSIIN